jgi:hypothetical protein
VHGVIKLYYNAVPENNFVLLSRRSYKDCRLIAVGDHGIPLPALIAFAASLCARSSA